MKGDAFAAGVAVCKLPCMLHRTLRSAPSCRAQASQRDPLHPPRHSRCQGSTFGIPGVEQHAHFLRDVRHAEAIRNKLINNIALAGVPGGLWACMRPLLRVAARRGRASCQQS